MHWKSAGQLLSVFQRRARLQGTLEGVSSAQVCVRKMIRGVWQLQKLTLRYCPTNGSSSGVRQFLRNNAAEFAKQNPQLEVHAAVGAGKHPIVIGSYAWGDDKVVDIKNADPENILNVLADLRNTTGRKITKIKKEVYGKVESVQGKWEPGIR